MMPIQQQASCKSRRKHEGGFTLIETMIAMVVLSIGILSLAAMLASSLAFMSASQFDYIAQQKAAAAVESIYTARNLGQATWSTICNVGSTVCAAGIFVNGAQPLCDPGPDEISGTADDFTGTVCSGPPDAIWSPGATGTFSSLPIKVPLTTYSFQRTITIAAFPNVANLRTITVLITYRAGRFQKSYTLTAQISNFS
jgi:prepilin-type N-terminal cleavage/methylation domain-containing protein